MARSQYVTEQLAKFPWQEQVAVFRVRSRTVSEKVWVRLSEETEEYYDNGRKHRTIDHISLEFFEDPTPIMINGIPVGGGLRFMRRESDGELFFRGYNTLSRCQEDGRAIYGAALPEGTHKIVRQGLEELASSLFNDEGWKTRERMVLRLQEMERAAGKVADKREELQALEIEHTHAAEAAADAVAKVRCLNFPK